MHCRNCGKEVAKEASVCVACGVPTNKGNKHCWNCGVDTDPNAELCVKCGVNLKKRPGGASSGDDWLTTLLLSILPPLIGFCGIHRFYTGQIGLGILQLLTLGGCGIWQIIDIVLIATGKFKDAEGNVITND